MKKIVFLIVLLHALLNVSAQIPTIYFSRTFILYPGLASSGVRAITMPDGYAFTAIEGIYGNPKGSAVIITDKAGNFIKTKNIIAKDYPYTYVTGLKYNPQDSTFLIWGEYFKDIPKRELIPFIMKSTFEIDTIWNLDINIPNYNACRSVIELPSGDYIMGITGTVKTGKPDTMKIVCVSKDGEIKWHKKYAYGFYVYQIYGLLNESDSTFLVGYSGFNIKSDSIGIPFWDAYGLMRLDFEGNVKRHKYFPIFFGGGDYYTGYLTRIGKSRLAFVNRTPPFHPGGLQWINCVDEDWNLLWQKSPTKNPEYMVNYIPSITTNEKGNIVGCSDIIEKYKTTQVFEINPDGEVVMQRILPRPLWDQQIAGFTSFESITLGHDGGYALAGIIRWESSSYRPSWLLKIDSSGCLEPGCEFWQYMTGKPLSTAESHFSAVKVFPNPVDDHLMISVGNKSVYLIIYDLASGRLMHSMEVSSLQQVQISVKDWQAGVYAIHVRDEGGHLLESHKLIVQHR